MRARVIYAHGLFLSGRESLFLARRLEATGLFDVRPFRYPSTANNMSEIVDRLERFIEAQDAAELHFIGHSLGGLVLYRYFERRAVHANTAGGAKTVGRVIFLGTPAVRSRAAERIGVTKWAPPLVGRAVAQELFAPSERRWNFAPELGIVAGTRPVGLGQFFAQFSEPSDGTVAVAETQLPGMTDHISLPVSHMGLLLSARVAEHCSVFLRLGHFSLKA